MAPANNQENHGIENRIITDREVIEVLRRALRNIDSRLIDHGERVAFIIHEMLEEDNLLETYDWRELFTLSTFHDIGAYKTEEIDNMVQFETHDVWSHAIYGYLFLKNMTSLGDCTEAILFHHASYEQLEVTPTKYADYAALINLADRVDVLVAGEGLQADLCVFEREAGHLFSPRFVDLFLRANQNRAIVERVASGDIAGVVEEGITAVEIPQTNVFDYLRMLVNAIDFRSPFTVTHTMTTMTVACELATLAGMNEEEVATMADAALLHDIGKIATPISILEKPGKLDAQEMNIMRQHVLIGETIISGLVPDKVRDIAMRHHEKLDGSGYPRGLCANDLSLQQRILVVADILSALVNKRSYKEPFPKEVTLDIIKEMSARGELCPQCCELLADNYDDVVKAIEKQLVSTLSLYEGMMTELARMRSLIETYGDEAVPVLLA